MVLSASSTHLHCSTTKMHLPWIKVSLILILWSTLSSLVSAEASNSLQLTTECPTPSTLPDQGNQEYKHIHTHDVDKKTKKTKRNQNPPESILFITATGILALTLLIQHYKHRCPFLVPVPEEESTEPEPDTDTELQHSLYDDSRESRVRYIISTTGKTIHPNGSTEEGYQAYLVRTRRYLLGYGYPQGELDGDTNGP